MSQLSSLPPTDDAVYASALAVMADVSSICHQDALGTKLAPPVPPQRVSGDVRRALMTRYVV